MTEPKNLLCNFRAPDKEHFKIWQRFKAWCQDNGLDICRVALNQVEAFMAAVDSAGTAADIQSFVTSKRITINIQQHNKFIYSVDKARRLPINLSYVKPAFRRTISSLSQDAYVLDRARRLGGEFSFQDFGELEYNQFRTIVRRLRRKGRIVTYPQRSIPQMYVVAENLAESMSCASTIQ